MSVDGCVLWVPLDICCRLMDWDSTGVYPGAFGTACFACDEREGTGESGFY